MGMMEQNPVQIIAGHAPRKPGVYLMKDGTGAVIYVGKAKDLHVRLRTYASGKDTRPMIPFLLPKIRDVEVMVTETEKEALILENTLIKKYRPRYNVTLRDDKNYFSIRVDTRQEFPRLELVRRGRKDGARYFGPYASSQAVKETLKFLRQVFPLRTCKDLTFRTRRRPCIEYEIKRCLAPCVGRVSAEDYRRLITDTMLFLEGRGKKLTAALRDRMEEASRELRFEEAGLVRDRIRAIESTLEKQRAVSASFRDQDVFGLCRAGRRVQACVIFVRAGRIVGQKQFPPLTTRMELSGVLSSLLAQYYDGEVDIPEEIIIQEDIEDREVLADWLAGKKEKGVAVIVPRRGRRAEILHIAVANAQNACARGEEAGRSLEAALTTLARRLHLRKVPRRIECFDISNLGGRHAVGSMVTFTDGEPDKDGYRRYRITTGDTPDDYGMMHEVLARRYGKRENLPDLIIVDGGKGQLSVALTVLEETGCTDVDAAALAKEPRMARKNTGGSRAAIEDRVYLPHRKNPVFLSREREALHLLQRIRDEAHRFAVAYHHAVKEKEDLRSLLDGIPGVGEKRKKTLLSRFGTVDAVGKASPEELGAVPGIGARAAAAIHAFFHGAESRKSGGESQS